MVVTKVEMMTKIKYKVYLDEQFAFVLYKGELSHYRISEGALLEEETVQEILQKVICKRAKLRAMHLLEDMDRSEAALREKLVQGLYPEEAVEAAISYVRSFGYLDDARYAMNFVQSRKSSKSRREILYQLCQKGVSKETAKEAVEAGFDHEDETDAIRRILEKKRVDPGTATPQQMQKLYGHLARKGFRYEDIRQVIQNYDENA
ncbi:MAG: regulatory protein RecX [Eubacteriales bacterium]|nr:regulatory protein RecX [Eubacteriales bacterium]MDO4598888.1 regulatory protein RecX [Mediterraneibacter gnavus]